MTPTIISNISAFSTPAIVLLGAAFIAYNQTRQNNSKVSGEVITTYKEQVAQLKEEVKNCKDALHECQNKMTALETAGQEKDKQIKAYEAIIANRNPALEKVLASLNTGLSNIGDFMKRIDAKMSFTEIELKKQTGMMTKQ